MLPGPNGPGSGRGDDNRDGEGDGVGGASSSGGTQPAVVAVSAGAGGSTPTTGCDAFACEACRDCAAAGPCNDLVTACALEPVCATALDCLTTCFNSCGGDPFCVQQCGVPCNDGTGAVQAANDVIDCACQLVCGLACAADDLDECESNINTAPL